MKIIQKLNSKETAGIHIHDDELSEGVILSKDDYKRVREVAKRLGWNKKALECVICEKPLCTRPNNMLLQHRFEGIEIIGICQKEDCWIKLGKRMSAGKH